MNKMKDFGSEELNLKFINRKLPWNSVSQVEENFSFTLSRETNVNVLSSDPVNLLYVIRPLLVPTEIITSFSIYFS